MRPIWTSPIEPALAVDASDRVHARWASRRRSFIVAAVGGQDDVAVEHQPADAHLVELLRPVGREADEVAVLLDDRLGNAVREREPRMLGHVPGLAMDRNDDLRPDPVVHCGKLGPAGMARDMDMRLPLGDISTPSVGELVHDPPDRDLVARDLLATRR